MTRLSPSRRDTIQSGQTTKPACRSMTPNREMRRMGELLRELADVRAIRTGPAVEPDHAIRRADVERALRLHREVEAFERRWPEYRTDQPMVPGFSWSQLERQLAD